MEAIEGLRNSPSSIALLAEEESETIIRFRPKIETVEAIHRKVQRLKQNLLGSVSKHGF